jgi:hypothetical protein
METPRCPCCGHDVTISLQPSMGGVYLAIEHAPRVPWISAGDLTW